MNKLAEKHKELIAKFKEKTGLSDYQVIWITFAKGLIIGAIFL